MYDKNRHSRRENANANRHRVLSWAKDKGIYCESLNGGNQLKIDSLNFYPTTGSINRDGCPADPDIRGADAFIDLVESSRPAKLSISLSFGTQPKH